MPRTIIRRISGLPESVSLVVSTNTLFTMGIFNWNKKKEEAKNPYHDLRNMAFAMQADALGLASEANDPNLYGVIMDWDMGNGVVTLVTYRTGDTSLYISSGGGFIGAGQHEDVNQLVQSFVAISDPMLQEARKDEDTGLPGQGEIVFHFLTTQGKFTLRDKLSAMEDRTSPYLPYFEAANQVITAIRIASERT